jgi:membrane protease YdiL (CAAX protease family)
MVRPNYISIITSLFLLFTALPAVAEGAGDSLAGDGAPIEAGRAPGIIFPQVLSFFLPGFDQFWEGERLAGIAYSGVGIAALMIEADQNHQAELRFSPQELQDEEDRGVNSKDSNIRARNFARQTFQATGGISAYHSFRTATKYRKKIGQFAFLEKQDTIADVLRAPVNFSFLARSSTWIPLAIGGAFSLLSMSPAADQIPEVLKPQDYLYSGLFSYNAGTHEEAVFRGWIMPVSRYYTDSDLWSNLISSSLFALAHVSTVKVPLPQLLLGFHLGYVTQKNHWSIAESVFIHVWWDVLAFLAIYQTPQDDLTGAQRTMPFLLPPLEWHF